MKKLALTLAILFAFAFGGVAQQLSFDFEDGTLQGWTVLDGDGDGHCWEPSTGGMGHNSNGMVLAYSRDYATGDSLAPNEFLVSPRLVLKEDWAEIYFWVCALDEIYCAEHFGLAISTTVNDDPLAFTTLQEWTLTAKEEGNRQGNWYIRAVDLSDYAGQEVYVAIHHHYCSGQSAICVDDIEISGTIPEPLPFAPLGAEWYFDVFNPWGTHPEYERFFVEGDTIIQGHHCSIINQNFVDTGHEGGEFVYEEDNKVYWFNPTTNAFSTLYDFDAEAGESWYYEVGECSHQVVVDSVGSVTWNGHTYRTQWVRFNEDVQYYSGKIIEGIGYEKGLFPSIYVCDGLEMFDAEEIEYLRCYVNDGEMLYHEGGYDCDQTTITPPSHPEWYYEILNENGTITYQYMYQAGDTIINDEPTHILVKINTLYDKGLREEVTHEYVFELNGKLYWWNKRLGLFTVLYDYEAEVGDSWTIMVGIEPPLTMHVDGVDYIEYEGRTYRVMRVSDPENLFSGNIVCGIGHLTSFFPERLMDNGDGLRVEGLRCYWIEDELVFKPGDEDCDAIYSEVHGVEEDGPSTGSGTFAVYPNPTNGVLFVETHGRASLSTQTYRINNLMGQTLLKGQIAAENQQIDVSSLPQGMYFITFAGETRKFVVR